MDLVLIAGLPATGKSRFAEYAGKALGLPLICKDSIKEILFDRVGFRSHEGKTRLNYASFDIMLYAARQMLLRGASVILETILDKGIMPSEKVLDFPVDCNTLTGSVNL